jgi:hypothetical protein
MKIKGMLASCLLILFLSITPFSASQRVSADSETDDKRCVAEALDQIDIIRSLPQKEYLHTIDGQDIRLHEFFVRCKSMFPWCCLYTKFYYWKSEVKTVTSDSANGQVTHKIRTYHNCLCSCCPQRRDPLKTHGDVAEFYDSEGEFMGLGVYMGAGKYCPLPYGGYHKKDLRVF